MDMSDRLFGHPGEPFNSSRGPQKLLMAGPRQTRKHRLHPPPEGSMATWRSCSSCSNLQSPNLSSRCSLPREGCGLGLGWPFGRRGAGRGRARSLGGSCMVSQSWAAQRLWVSEQEMGVVDTGFSLLQWLQDLHELSLAQSAGVNVRARAPHRDLATWHHNESQNSKGLLLQISLF